MKKDKVIHCRVTADQQQAIAAAAAGAGLSITQYVIRAALSETPTPAD